MPASAPVPAPFRQHLSETLRLGVPVMAARAGLLVMFIVLTILVGHSGGTELAFLGLGMAPQIVLLLIGIGLTQGTLVLVAQAHGAGEDGRTGSIFKVGAVQALAFGAVAGLLLQLSGPAFHAIGQDPAIADGAGRVTAALAWGMPGILLFSAATYFLEGIGRPRPGLVAMIAGNLVSAGLGWILIAGPDGQGALGAAWAITAARWVMGLGLALHVWFLPDRDRLGVRAPIPAMAALAAKMRRVGLPVGLAQGLESASFAGIVVLAGYLGPDALAGYQITMNLVATMFMAAIGISTASAVRVGHAVGRGDRANMARAGWTGMGLVAVVLAGAAALFATAPEAIARIYTDDPGVLAVAGPAIAFAAWFLIFDGTQAVAMGILRGAGDVWMPSILQLVAFWGLALPAAAVFAFWTEAGTLGLLGGITVGVVAATALLATRFALVARRAVRRL